MNILTRNFNAELNVENNISVYVDKVPEYSLSILENGSEFPSKEQSERLLLYKRNKALLKGDISRYLPLIQRRVAEMLEFSISAGSDTYLSIPSSENYYKIIVDKVIKLANGCGGYTLSSYIDNKVLDTVLNDIQVTFNKKKVTNKIISDVVTYGESVVLLYKDSSTGYGLQVVEPTYWIPVVDVFTDDIINHIVYKVVEVNNHSFIIVQVHYKGYYTKLTYNYSDNKLGDLAEEPIRVDTGLSDFAVKVINTSGELFGYDMLTPMHNIVTQNIVDMTLNDYANNRNTVPMMQGSDQFLDKGAPRYVTVPDSSGKLVRRQLNNERYFAYKSYYPIPGGDGTGTTPVKIEQVKVDLDTTSYLKKVEERRKSLGQITGMVGTMRSFNNEGQAQSGKAKRLEYESDIQTVNNIVLSVKDTLKECVADCLKLIGLNVDTRDICVDWKVDILLDEYEVAELEKMRLESNSTSIESSLIRQYGYTDEEVAKELELIKENKKSFKEGEGKVVSSVEVDTIESTDDLSKK